MKIKEITLYKGRFCALLENGLYVLNNGSMELVVAKKEPALENGHTGKTLRIVKGGLVGGIMMRTEKDFRWCVENLREEDVALPPSPYRDVQLTVVLPGGKKKTLEGLFSAKRLKRSEVPEGYNRYAIRHNDDDFVQPDTLEPGVLINHFGDFLCTEDLSRQFQKAYNVLEITEFNFI